MPSRPRRPKGRAPQSIPSSADFSRLFLALLVEPDEAQALRQLRDYRRRFRAEADLTAAFGVSPPRRRGRPLWFTSPDRLAEAIRVTIQLDGGATTPAEWLRERGLDASSGSPDFTRLRRMRTVGRLALQTPEARRAMRAIRDQYLGAIRAYLLGQVGKVRVRRGADAAEEPLTRAEVERLIEDLRAGRAVLAPETDRAIFGPRD